MTDTPTAEAAIASFRAALADVNASFARYEAERDALVAGLRQLLAEVDAPARSRRGQLGTFGRSTSPQPVPMPAYDGPFAPGGQGSVACTLPPDHKGEHDGSRVLGRAYGRCGWPVPSIVEQIANKHDNPCPTGYATGGAEVLRCRRAAGHAGDCRELNAPPGRKARTW